MPLLPSNIRYAVVSPVETNFEGQPGSLQRFCSSDQPHIVRRGFATAYAPKQVPERGTLLGLTFEWFGLLGLLGSLLLLNRNGSRKDSQ